METFISHHDQVPSAPLRTVTFVESGERVRLPGATPTVSKPWNMGPAGGAAVVVAEREGRLLLRYTAEDGTEAEILSLPLTLAEHNPGDELLLKVPENDAEGHPIYRLVAAGVD